MQQIVVLAGRFQPVHPGHAAVYRWLQGRFGAEAVYVATSDKHDPPDRPARHPFNFAEKRLLISALTDIPEDRVVRTRVPYRPVELLERFDPEQDALILAVSEKDAERLGGGRYLRPLPEVGAPLLPFGEAGHVVIAPLFHEGLDASGIRAHLRSTTEPRSERFSFLQALYQRDSEEAFDLLISRLSPQGLASASMTDKNCP